MFCFVEAANRSRRLRLEASNVRHDQIIFGVDEHDTMPMKLDARIRGDGEQRVAVGYHHSNSPLHLAKR